MRMKRPAFLSELPAAPDHNPVRKAIEKTADPEVLAALRSFASMPQSTAVLANPPRFQQTVSCDGTPVELQIRSFAIRGCLLEEDIVRGAADCTRAIFVGLFGRFASAGEHRLFGRWLTSEFRQAVVETLPGIAKFMRSFPAAAPEVAIQYMAAMRKAAHRSSGINSSRAAPELLSDLIRTHFRSVAAGACSSYLRRKGRGTMKIDALLEDDAFRSVFNLFIGRKVNNVEYGILQNLGAIQIHHGSAGSSMVARYFGSLHTRSTSDLFVAGQMAMDCARHFGAITDLTDFVRQLERTVPKRRDDLIRIRALNGNLPTFGHPEIAAAGRENRIELDPRPAIYLSPLFAAIDSGSVKVSDGQRARVSLVQRIYQMAFVEGIEKPGRKGLLRVAPNTDFGAWIVQEILGIADADRTLFSYVFRGFGWMMDVREQLQQPIIRPVIPPDPGIHPPQPEDRIIPSIVEAVHMRLSSPNAFVRKTPF